MRKRNNDKQVSANHIALKTTPALKETKKWLEGLLKLRKSEKLYKTYITGIKNAINYNNDPKIYVDYRLDGTVTGRLSNAAYTAKKAMGVSFHTLPRDTTDNIRSIVVAPLHHAFITSDYSAMELRVLAHISKDAEMQKAFWSGEDLHKYTASLLFNKDTSKITPSERQIAKTVSFLIVYGGGAYNLANTVNISMKRAENIINKYMEVFPSIFTYMEFIKQFIIENKYAYSIFGRRRHLPNIDSRNIKIRLEAIRQGVNFTVQSPASDILLCALIRITQKLKEANLGARIVSTVHDSIESISLLDELPQTLEIIQHEMINYTYAREMFDINLNVPLGVETLVGFSFGDGMEAEYNNGQVSNASSLQEYFNDN